MGGKGGGVGGDVLGLLLGWLDLAKVKNIYLGCEFINFSNIWYSSTSITLKYSVYDKMKFDKQPQIIERKSNLSTFYHLFYGHFPAPPSKGVLTKNFHQRILVAMLNGVLRICKNDICWCKSWWISTRNKRTSSS